MNNFGMGKMKSLIRFFWSLE